MFQGSGQVKGNGHFDLVQGAGGSLNGTTSFERTNYFETVPTHQLELALWLEADRMGLLLAASTRSPSRTSGTWSRTSAAAVRQRPLRHGVREADRPGLPGGPPVPPHPDRLDGRPGRGDPGGRSRVLPHLVRAEQRRALGRRRHRHGADARLGREVLRLHRAHDGKPAPRDGTLPGSSASSCARSSRRRSRPAR